VLTHCGDLWVRMHKEMGDKDYPEIKQDYIHDAMASGKIKSLSAGKMGMGTREVGDMIAKLVS
jgi:3-isopropylmalate dehydrogenase